MKQVTIEALVPDDNPPMPSGVAAIHQVDIREASTDKKNSSNNQTKATLKRLVT